MFHLSVIVEFTNGVPLFSDPLAGRTGRVLLHYLLSRLLLLCGKGEGRTGELPAVSATFMRRGLSPSRSGLVYLRSVFASTVRNVVLDFLVKEKS